MINKPRRSHRICEICHLREVTITGKPLFFARFPIDENICKQWLKVVGNEELVYLPIEKLNRIRFICGNHFSKEDFNKKGNRLKKHAVPKINLYRPPLTDAQMLDFPQHLFSRNVSMQEEMPDTSQEKQPISSEPDATVFMQEAMPGTSQEKQPIPNKPHATDMSPREKKLIEELKKTKYTLASLKKSAQLIENIESPILKELVLSAFQNQKRKPTGRRWSKNIKAAAICILKRSPKTYRFLQNIIPLLSVKTLGNLLQKVTMAPGINYKVIEYLKSISSDKSIRDRLCALVFDEMSISSHLTYDMPSDKIEGYEDYGPGYERTDQLANHALVFMLQGIHEKFKQPVAFYFVKDTVSSQKLASIIIEIIRAINSTGFKVIVTICDQGSTNMGGINILKKMTHSTSIRDINYFMVDGQKSFIVYDVPHLFKSIRNNFLLNGTIHFNNRIGYWSHLTEVEKKNKNLLYFSKISSIHTKPKGKAKMKVKLAAQMLSHTVSAVLKLMTESSQYQGISTAMMDTALIIEELNKPFDFTNGPSCAEDVRIGLRQNVSLKTNHLKVWRDFKEKLLHTKFIDGDGKPSTKVKCLRGYVLSMDTLRDIWYLLRKKYGFRYMNLRQFNQDALENIFGMIRQYNPTNRNPTCTNFIAALKSTIISGLTAPHSRSANCQKDYQKLLTDFQDMLSEENLSEPDLDQKILVKSIESESVQITDIHREVPVLTLPEEFDIVETDFIEIDKQPLVYVSGYIASTVVKNLDCVVCEQAFEENNPESNRIYSYITLREWWKDRHALTYPSIKLCELVQDALEIFEKEIINQLYVTNICQLTVTLFFSKCDIRWMNCETHVDMPKIVLVRLARLLIRRQCQRINQGM